MSLMSKFNMVMTLAWGLGFKMAVSTVVQNTNLMNLMECMIP